MARMGRSGTCLSIATMFGALMALGCGAESEGSGMPAAVTAGSELELRAGTRVVALRDAVGFTRTSERVSHALELSSEFGRTTLLLEHRLSANEALARLEEIAAEQAELSRFFGLGGGRALERVRVAAPPLPSFAPSAERGAESPVITIAVAHDDIVLRLEAALEKPYDSGIRSALIGVLTGFQVRTSRPASAAVLDAFREGTPPARVGIGADATEPPVLEFSPSAGFNDRINAGAGTDAEIEVAVSDDGRDIVVVNNARDYTTSNTFGQSFSGPQNLTGGPPANGDPSIAWAQSGAFYYAYIAFPNGTPASGNVTGCSTGIHASTDGGQNFAFQNHAFVSPLTGPTISFPDQEHIAADRNNASGSGGDQVYSVWRDFPSAAPSATSCCDIRTAGACPAGSNTTLASPTPSIVCSTDGAANWTARVAVGSGDFPRLTVGPDGFVYVVFMSGSNLMLNKFSSCDTGLVQQAGMPVTVATGVNQVNCGAGGVAGLDRCNSGTDGRSPTVAVAEDDASHVFVAYASNSAANNENVFVRDSTDGGQMWTRPAVQLNAATTGHRFMPWVCATGDTAFVSWYDMRAGVTGASNDLAEFFAASAVLDGSGDLVANPDFTVSQAPDPLCATWPSVPRAVVNSENCSVQPQQAGLCAGTGVMGVPAVRCDFSDCPGAACNCGDLDGDTVQDACNTGQGGPKYGDYNGSACVAGRFYTAWASRTAAPGDPQPVDVDVFFACTPDEDDVNGSFADTTDPFFDVFPPDIDSNTCDVGPIGQAVAFDACGDGAPTVMNDAPASFDPGTTTVTWTATDTANNSTTREQIIEITDTTAPLVFCPADQTAECIDGTATVTFPDPTASDDCDLASVACVPPSGSVFDLGDTTVTCTATDTSDNTAECALNVAVVDTIPPEVTVAGAGELWPPNHQYISIGLEDCGIEIDDQCQGIIDLEDANPVITCVTSDEVEDGAGDGNTVSDMVILDATTVNVRAERTGGGDGRVYTIHFEVSDAANNVTAAACLVSVRANQGAGGPAVDSGVAFGVGACN